MVLSNTWITLHHAKSVVDMPDVAAILEGPNLTLSSTGKMLFFPLSFSFIHILLLF